MTNNIQCSIESSTTKIELNSAVEGVFLVPELEGLAGLPEIRTTSGVNAGYDGGWTSAQNYDARLISIRGIIANPDVAQVEAKRRAIASLLGQGRKEQLTLRLTTEAGNSYAISVRTISCEMALQRVLTTQEFLIQLRADDPLIYDDGASAGTEAILHVQRALGGFEINFELPLAIGGGAESTIVENGEEMVYPIIKLYGPLHSPTVVNTTTNQQMQLNADLQYTVNWSGYENEEGSAIAISDGIENAPMSLTQLNGNAEQTTYSGKNLLETKNTTRTISGVTFTPQADGSIKLSGTASAQINYPINRNSDTVGQNITIPAGTYTVLQSGLSAMFVQVYYNEIGSGTKYSTSTFTTTESASLGAYIRVNNGTNTTGTTIYPMFVAGSTAGDWEPYVGSTATSITPSPNPDYPQAIETVTGEQTLTVTGKNLFDISKVITASNNKVVNNGDGSLTVSGYAVAAGSPTKLKNYCPTLKVGDTVVLSADSDSTQQYIYLYGTNQTWSYSSHIPRTISQSDLDSTVFWYNSQGDTVVTIKDIQVEVFPNLLNPDKIVADSDNAQTYLTNGNKWIHFRTGGIQMKIKNPDGRSGAFSLSAIVKSGDATTNVIRFVACYTDGTNATIGDVTTTGTNEHTVTATTNASKTLDYILTANTYAKDALMKIAGSYFGEVATATAYVPYQGTQTQTILISGKNMLGGVKWEQGTIAGATGLDGNSTTRIRTIGYIEGSPQTSYAISCVDNLGYNALAVAFFYDKNKTYLGRTDSYFHSVPYIFTSMADTAFIRVLICHQSGGSDTQIIPQNVSNIQLEQGSSATTYEAPIELAKIGTYRDKIYFDADTSKWMLQKNTQKLKLTSTINMNDGALFTNNNDFTYFYSKEFDATLPNIASTNVSTSMASFAKAGAVVYTSSPATDITKASFGWDTNVNSINRLRLCIPTSFVGGTSLTNAQRLANWKSMLDANDFYIIAPLQTPTDTEITDDTLLAQLNIISELYGGQNNISLVPSAGAQGTMTIQYATEYTVDQDVAVIDSQARTITINGQDAYHLKTAESEFLLLAPGENKLYLTSASETDEGYAEVKFKQGYLSI